MASVDDRLAALEEENRRLAWRVYALEQTVRPPPPTTWQPAPAQGAQPSTAPATPPPQPRGQARHLDATTLESRIGARWVAAAGGVVLLLATVFFLRLAFDRGWIGPLARIWIGVVAGAAIWMGGEALRRRVHAAYGEVLAGTGVGLLYVTTWIAFDLERYRAVTGLSPAVGVALLAAIVALLVAHAGLVRGPVLAGTALALVHVESFVSARYDTFSMAATVLLAAGVLGVAAWRRWDNLYLAGTTVFATLWIHASGVRTDETVVLAATLVLVAAWVAASFLPWGMRAVAAVAASGAWLLGGFAAAAAAGGIWQPDQGMGWTLLALAVAAGAVALLPSPGRYGHGASALVLAAVWPVHLTDWPWPAVVWAVLLAGVAVAHARRRSMFGRVALYGLLAVSVLWAFVRGVDLAGAWAWEDGVAYAAVVVASVAAWWLHRKTPDIAWPALVVSFVAALTAWTAYRSDPWVTLAWAVIAAVALGAGALLRAQDLRLGGLGVIAVLLLRIVFIDLAGADEVVRIVAFMGVGVALLGIGYLYARFLRRRPSAETSPPAGPPLG